jgi:predicted SprT family Zn-dependent metalloprotease
MLVRSFLKECRAQARQAELELVEVPPVDERDLQAIYDRLNQEYFNGKVEAQVEWGKNIKIPNRRSFSFGSYDSKNKLIRVHPRLKQDFVPVSVLELTVHHEMCHQAAPPVRRNGQWQMHHKDFKAKEKEYLHYREAMQWEKKHWIKLMAPAPE